jgi:Leucine rich repeat
MKRFLPFCNGFRFDAISSRYTVMMGQHGVLEQAKRTRQLHLSAAELYALPQPITDLTMLLRLDLSFNRIAELPGAMFAALSNLEQLWLNNNPLLELPATIEHAKQLQVLDLRNTKLVKLPCELSRLPHLIDVDVHGVPLQGALCKACTSTTTLLAYLGKLDSGDLLRDELMDKLAAQLYRDVALTKEGRRQLPAFADAVCAEFTSITELRQVVRHCDRLCPPTLVTDAATATVRMRQQYTALRRETQMKELSAELELKLRALYYDRIDVAAVDSCVKAVYSRVTVLEDMQFLIKHAAQALPKNSEDITGDGVLLSIKALQQQAAAAKQARVAHARKQKPVRPA